MVNVIELQGLTKTYGARRGLVDLSLEVRRGEVFGYLGPNGAGKSTTIRLLLDLIRPTAGSARVLGLDPRRDAMRLHAEIGYLAGDFVVPGRQRVGAMLRFLAALRGGVAPQRIDALCERLELDQDAQVSSLSKGNRQKLGLVQAFMHIPQLLILDEPTSGLDPLGQQIFLDMVAEASDNGQTVFMSSHIMSEVEAVADRVGIIREGRLVALNTVSGLRANAVRDVEVTFAEPVTSRRVRRPARCPGCPGGRHHPALPGHRKPGRTAAQDRHPPRDGAAGHRTRARGPVPRLLHRRIRCCLTSTPRPWSTTVDR
ncbi:ABC transporter ATP-binding protein [Nocardia amamiensis]|uniref:ABC transporter ATP-binding protein n=1 Tax=Nocardia amamiensis TaxID=404578 RepID=UPI001E4C1B45|nr:ABC transporter ATP-binding protein [Nocardia amamiensis]